MIVDSLNNIMSTAITGFSSIIYATAAIIAYISGFFHGKTKRKSK